MTDWDLRRCKATDCPATIAFARTQRNKSIPIEWNPDARAPREYVDNGCAGRIQVVPSLFVEDGPIDTSGPVVDVLGKGDKANPDVPIWLSHFVTCAPTRTASVNETPDVDGSARISVDRNGS